MLVVLEYKAVFKLRIFMRMHYFVFLNDELLFTRLSSTAQINLLTCGALNLNFNTIFDHLS